MLLTSFHSQTWTLHQVCMGKCFSIPFCENNILNNIIFFYLYFIQEYIGESGRTFGERFREHLKTPSPIFNHQNTSGHRRSIDNFKIIGREENNVARTIQEAMFIRVNNPTLNKNIGKYNLSHIWDRILFTILELKLKK